MRTQSSNLRHEPGSEVVILRFCARMIVVAVFAAFAGVDFGRNVAALLWMATILCAAMGVIRRELPLDTTLNHWDEAIICVAVCYLLTGVSQLAAT